MLGAATKKALEVSNARSARPGEAKAAEEQRHRELVDAIDQQTIELPISNQRYGLARLHASVIGRLLRANDRTSPKPIARIYPRRLEVIIDLNLEYRGGRMAARQWVLENIERAKAESNVRDAGQGIHFEKDRPDSQYLFARLEARAIQCLVALDVGAAKEE